MVTAHEAGNLLVLMLVEGASWGSTGRDAFRRVHRHARGDDPGRRARDRRAPPSPPCSSRWQWTSAAPTSTLSWTSSSPACASTCLPPAPSPAPSSRVCRWRRVCRGGARWRRRLGRRRVLHTSFGDEREAVPWAEFEAKLRTSMVTSDGAWEVALPTLKSAIETTGGEVKFATFRASFSTSDASFAETLKSMAETVESKETIFDITLRDASTKEVDERLDPTFIMVKRRPRSRRFAGTMDCFNEDEEDLGDLAFLQGGDFAFVFKTASGGSGCGARRRRA